MSLPMVMPELSAAEIEHSGALTERICQQIAAHGGWISFERFMELALYEPGLGYYSAGATKFGRDGDFVTAPEISPLFSHCLARQCSEVIERLKPADILEVGAGSGAMAVEVLLELAAQRRLPQRYYILEVSAQLRARQQQVIAARIPEEVAARVVWLDTLPTDFRGIVLANEVLDAFPVQRFCVRGTQIKALGVTWRLNRFEWAESRAEPALEAAVRGVERARGELLPDGYVSEINLRLQPWINGIAHMLHEGVALFIDYGLPQQQYYRNERSEGTLLCHFRHRFHDDPLINVGLQDIGAWVDFTAVANAASEARLRVAGFTTQAHFLIGCGIEHYLSGSDAQPMLDRMQLARQAMMLTLPGEMGERFKVLGLAANYDHPLCGFGVRDLVGAL